MFLCSPLIARAVPTPEQKAIELPPVVEPPKVVLSSSVSAFTSSVDETDSTPNITASGTHVHSGTAACPIRFPFGTVIEVNGKRYVCEDRMAERFRHGNYFDLWMPSKASALQWGRRTVEVTILK